MSTCASSTFYSTKVSYLIFRSFPTDIPSLTAVPGWAYENVTVTGTFDPQSALADSAPESTATHVQSTQTAVGSSGTHSATASSSAVPSSGGKSSNHAGAIAGGVVGGIVGVALIALVAFLLIRRQKNKRSPSPAGSPIMQEKMDPQYQPVPYAPTPTSPQTGGFMAQQPKLYVCTLLPLLPVSFALFLCVAHNKFD